MTQLQHQLKSIADARRLEILPYVFEQTKGLVQTGPFAGMTIVPYTSWGDGDSGAKLLGIYEDELHNVITDAVESAPTHIVNVGCAEGYYIVGLCKLLPNVTAVAIDMDSNAVVACNKNKEANHATKLQILHKEGNTTWLQTQCNLTERPLLVMDCEGAELDLLDLTLVPSLAKTTILVECHDCVRPGITESLQDRFKETHTVDLFQQKYKDPYQFEFLRHLSDCDKWALVHEGRPSAMTWLYMVPKA